MNVSMDPRLLKQLLLSQWVNNANPLEPAATGGQDEGVFGTMLSALLGGDGSAATTADSTGLSLLQLGAALPAGLAGMTDRPYGEAGIGSSAYDGLIAAAAAKYGLDPALIKGVIQTESSFQNDVVSHAGAKGLMQLMEDTARGLGVTDAFDPAQNIDGGSRFLSYLLRKYDGNVTSALAAYNAGPGRVDRLGLTTDALVRERMTELPEETQHYIRRVLSAAQRWSAEA